MIIIQKIYGFQGLNHQMIEEYLDVTAVTEDERTDGKRKIEQCSKLNQKPQLFNMCLTLKRMLESSQLMTRLN